MCHDSSWEGKKLPKAITSFHALLGAIPCWAQELLLVTFTPSPPAHPLLSEQCQEMNNSSMGWKSSGS